MLILKICQSWEHEAHKTLVCWLRLLIRSSPSFTYAFWQSSHLRVWGEGSCWDDHFERNNIFSSPGEKDFPFGVCLKAWWGHMGKDGSCHYSPLTALSVTCWKGKGREGWSLCPEVELAQNNGIYFWMDFQRWGCWEDPKSLFSESWVDVLSTALISSFSFHTRFLPLSFLHSVTLELKQWFFKVRSWPASSASPGNLSVK